VSGGDDDVMRAALLVGLLVLTGCGGSDAARAPQTSGPSSVTVSSRAFANGATIPAEFTCRGVGSVPSLRWTGIPADADSVAIVVRDPDAPSGTFIHWVVYDLPGSDGELRAGQVPAVARETDNSAGSKGWAPPCPPSGTHHYIFSVYAIRGPVSGGSTTVVLGQIAKQAIATGQLTGTVTHA